MTTDIKYVVDMDWGSQWISDTVTYQGQDLFCGSNGFGSVYDTILDADDNSGSDVVCADSTTTSLVPYTNIQNGGKVIGKLTRADNGYAYFYEDGILDFDMTKTTAGKDALVNGLSFDEAAPTNTRSQSDLNVIVGTNESGVDFNGDLTSAKVDIRSGMVASGVDINASGRLNVYEGGLASVTTVNFGGKLYVSNGGKALQVKENGGYVNVSNGAAEVTFVPNAFSDLTLYGQNWATVHSGTTATNITANSRGLFEIYSGGLANNATVNSSGRVYVFGGGTMNNAIVNTNGAFFVSSGGTATDIAASVGACLGVTVAPATYVQGTYGDSAFEMKDAFIKDYTVHSGCWLGASGGGVAYNTTVEDGGTLYAYDGGLLSAATVDGGALMYIFESGSALQVKENGGAVFVEDVTAEVTFVSNTFSGLALCNLNRATAHSGTTATDITVDFLGGMYVYEGGIASAVEVNDFGVLCIYEGGKATGVTVNSGGSAEVSSGVIDGTAVNSGGNLLIYSGAKITGQIMFEEGAEVIPFVGSILDFDLTQAMTEEGALVNDLSVLLGTPTYTLTVDGTQALGTYNLAGGAARFNKNISVVDILGAELGTLTFETPLVAGGIGLVLNKMDSVLSVTIGDPDVLPTNLVGNSDGVSWDSTGSTQYFVEYATDNFEHVISNVVATSSLDTFGLTAGAYQWRVRANDGVFWSNGEEIVVEETELTPLVLQSDADGNADLFFARKYDIWNNKYYAKHGGLLDGWEGTGDTVSLKGKNQIADLFQGTTDSNLLCLTDDDNGDALFVDDIYSELPSSLEEQQARIAQIKEIRAGQGDDIVDMTSQRFQYVGDGVTVRGGLGNDVIWSNKGENRLFGDEGDDCIVGASDNDVLAGGTGDDTLHGGGGEDIFVFGGDWGNDTVKQLADGKVTLWFKDGDASKWNAEELTYTDGDNSVIVTGVSDVTLKFGDDGSKEYQSLLATGAFSDATSQSIFEEQNKGMLA